VILGQIIWHSFFFLLFAGLACGFALAVLLSSNVVRMAFYLILSLAAAAGLFLLAGAQFVGAMQIMIYVGGTLVLLIFGVMLTAQASYVSLKTGGGEWVVACVVGGSLLLVLVGAALGMSDWARPTREYQMSVPAAETESATRLGQAFLNVRVDSLDQADPQLRRGMSGYLLPFEIISIHLLVVLVGAAYLARARRRVPTGLSDSEAPS
jgi:NADH-quinone oxidoreductase subunit J